MTKPKFRPGPVVRCPVTVVGLILAGQKMYIGHKVFSYGWMGSHQLNMIATSARKGHYRIAVPIEGNENGK